MKIAEKKYIQIKKWRQPATHGQMDRAHYPIRTCALLRLCYKVYQNYSDFSLYTTCTCLILVIFKSFAISLL